VAKFVRYGPAPRYGIPDAGFCASSFVVLRKGTKVLAGIPKNHRKWREEWAPNWLVYTKESLEDEYRCWRLPASYLYEGENPDDAARRVLRDQLRMRGAKLGPVTHYAFHDPSSWYPGHKHYDLCFVYEVRGAQPRTVPPWWTRLEFVDVKALRKDDMGSSMSDLMKVLRLG
jgi:ADP-ribose pyrophosphatase YjhB (NUDIX family)